MKLGITGDTHGDLNFKRIFQARRLEYTHLIVCGDFGYVWNGNRKEQKQLDYLNKIGIKILFVDGNHEGFSTLNSYPIIEMYGGKVHQIRDNIIHLMRGEYYYIDGKTFWCMGGANSTDKEYRKEGKNWWKDEMPSNEELQYGFYNLKQHDMNVDYIVTHTCDSNTIKELCNGDTYRVDELTEYFSNILENTKYKHWYFGHMHTNWFKGNKTCLYNRIINVGDIL